jgi:YjbE family integral membrane protein
MPPALLDLWRLRYCLVLRWCHQLWPGWINSPAISASKDVQLVLYATGDAKCGRRFVSSVNNGVTSRPGHKVIVADLVAYQTLVVLASVIVIDVLLAGDNAIVVGMAAVGLPREQQYRVIALGIALAIVLRIGFALVTMELLAIIGLTLAGGVLLLWIAWKMYRELRNSRRDVVEAPSDGVAAKAKTFSRALAQVVLADVSMSLDNVLAVAGTARDHLWALVVGLILSVALMGVASTIVARLLDRHPWFAWIGLAIVTVVAMRMICEGSSEVMHHFSLRNKESSAFGS